MNEPQVIQTLISIAGAAALLIWAVRLVRTGVKRGFAVPMRVWLRHSAKNRLLAAGTGMGAAILLQSATAVAVLVSNFDEDEVTFSLNEAGQRKINDFDSQNVGLTCAVSDNTWFCGHCHPAILGSR